MRHNRLAVVVLLVLLTLLHALTGCAHSGRIMSVAQVWDGARKYDGKRVTIVGLYNASSVASLYYLWSEPPHSAEGFIVGVGLYAGSAIPPEQRSYRDAYNGHFGGQRMVVTGVLRYKEDTFGFDTLRLEVEDIRPADKPD